MKTILPGIRRRRLELGLSQQQLGDRLGLDRGNLANWETGRSLPSAALLPALARALECDVATLYEPGGEGGEESA